MTTENKTGDTPTPVPTPAPTTIEPAEVEIKLTPAKLKERLDETRAAGEARILKELGFDSITGGKKALDALKKLQEAQMTEQEKLAARLKELEPKAQAGEVAVQKYAAAVEREFRRLPENIQTVIDEQAKGDPATREMLMEMFAKVGATAATAPANATPRPANAGATPPAPKPVAGKSKWDEYQDLEKSDPFGASIFYQNHVREIEKTRPAQ